MIKRRRILRPAQGHHNSGRTAFARLHVIGRRGRFVFAVWLGAILILAAGAGSCLAAAPTIAADSLSLAGHLEVLEDKSGALTFDQVKDADGFRSLPGNLAAGFTRSAFWLRFTMERPKDSTDAAWYLEIGMPYLDHLDLYEPTSDGGIRVTKSGGDLPVSARLVPYRNFVFPLTLPEGRAQTYYLRVQARHTMTVQATLWTPDGFHKKAAAEMLQLGLLHGAALIIVLLAAIQFLISRDRLRGEFAVYVICLEGTFFCNDGLTAWLLLPDSPHAAGMLVSAIGCLAIGTGAWVSSPLLEVGKRWPRLHLVYRAIAYGGFAAAISVLVGQYSLVAAPVQLSSIALLCSQIVLAAIRIGQGDRAGWMFLGAFGVQIAAAAVLILRNIGFSVPITNLDVPLQIGLAFHLLFLNLGLGKRYKDMETERRLAQEALLAASRRYEQELEQRVVERTIDLAAANRALTTGNQALTGEIEKRQQTEAELIEARERAEAALSVQELALREQRNFLAMISHEFRTPLTIIAAAADMASALFKGKPGKLELELAKIRRALKRMTGLMDTCLADEWLESSLVGIGYQDIDLKALLTEIGAETAMLGTHRLCLNLPDEAVTMAGHKELLRILFQNLVGNAVKYSPQNGEIRISLTTSSDKILVMVSDDGPGIHESIRDQIFEKFFRGSAAAIGQGGAGLGIYLARRIAERHGGNVTLDPPEVERGASFTVKLLQTPSRRSAEGDVESPHPMSLEKYE